jgi:hypothetical protein
VAIGPQQQGDTTGGGKGKGKQKKSSGKSADSSEKSDENKSDDDEELDGSGSDDDNDDKSVASDDEDDDFDDEYANPFDRCHWYKHASTSERAMAKMFHRFCRIDSKSSCFMVKYFGLKSMEDLGTYTSDLWSDTYVQWGKKHPHPKNPHSRVTIMLSPPQKKRIECAAWACRWHARLPWPDSCFTIDRLLPEHYDPIKRQMDKELDCQVTLKGVPDLSLPDFSGLTDVGMRLKKVMNLCETLYGCDGRPLAWVIRPLLWAPPISSAHETLRGWADGVALPELFLDFDKVDFMSTKFSLIVPGSDNQSVKDTNNTTCINLFETGKKSTLRTQPFKTDTETVYAIFDRCFNSGITAVHFGTTVGRTPVCGRKIFLQLKNQFLGTDACRRQIEANKKGLQNMEYHGESKNWNYTKHTGRTLNYQEGIVFYANMGGFPSITQDELITYFLDSIKDDCGNTELLNYKSMVKANRADYPDINHVMGFLRDAITAQGGGGVSTKRTIASTSTDDRDKKKQRSSPKKPMSDRGKLQIKGDKVVGEIEGRHYSPDIWAKMSAAQRAEALALRKKKKAAHERSAAATSSANVDQEEFAQMKRTVAALSRERDRRRSSSSESSRHRERSRSHSSSHGGRDRGRDSGKGIKR